MSRRRKLIRINAAGDPVAVAEAAIAALSPVGWYKFNEGTGTAITNYGSLGAGANLAGAGSGGAWVTGGFDTEGTRSFTVASNLGISGTGARTLILVGTPASTASVRIAAQWYGATTGLRWTLRNTSGAATLRMEIGGEGFNETALTDLVVGTWAFMGASLPAGGNNLEDCTLYMNGGSEVCGGTTVTINTTATKFDVGLADSTVADMLIGYCLAFNTELSAPNIAAVRAAVTTIMAARGITLP